MLLVNWRRFIVLKLALIAILIIFSTIVTLLIKNKKVAPDFALQQAYFLKSKVQLQQNGPYFIYTNYIEANDSLRQGNRSITLALQGTYQDFKYMSSLLYRWHGPISFTMFSNGDDFEDTLVSLYFIKHCNKLSTFFFKFVSIHIVFHEDHFPAKFQNMLKTRPKEFDCLYEPPYISGNQNETYWYKKGLFYPINLLRNVARLNSYTYYVLSLDTDLFPSPNFIRKFLDFAKHYVPKNPLKTVYCIPVFPQLPDNELPKVKSDLVQQIYPFLRNIDALKYLPMYQDVVKYQEWLCVEQAFGKITEFNVTHDKSMCPVYVSVNRFEPFYEEHYYEKLLDRKSTRIALLYALQFNYVILDGTFLIKLLEDSWYGVEVKQTINETERIEAVQELIILNSLALWKTSEYMTIYNLD